MAAPTLEEFRRWLQAEIDDILNQDQDMNISKRLIQLETALQEAMAFTAAWDMRKFLFNTAKAESVCQS